MKRVNAVLEDQKSRSFLDPTAQVFLISIGARSVGPLMELHHLRLNGS